MELDKVFEAPESKPRRQLLAYQYGAQAMAVAKKGGQHEKNS